MFDCLSHFPPFLFIRTHTATAVASEALHYKGMKGTKSYSPVIECGQLWKFQDGKPALFEIGLRKGIKVAQTTIQN